MTIRRINATSIRVGEPQITVWIKGSYDADPGTIEIMMSGGMAKTLSKNLVSAAKRIERAKPKARGAD